MCPRPGRLPDPSGPLAEGQCAGVLRDSRYDSGTPTHPGLRHGRLNNAKPASLVCTVIETPLSDEPASETDHRFQNLGGGVYRPLGDSDSTVWDARGDLMLSASCNPRCRRVRPDGLEATESPTSPVATGILGESSDRGGIGHSHRAVAERRPTFDVPPRLTR